MPETPTDSVYVSYSWGAEDQTRLVDKLEAACRKRGIELKRDKKQIGYGQSIRAYMDELAAGRHVVVVLSDAYLKSRYCMYELREITKHGSFCDRVLPIVLRGTSFVNPEDRIPYFEYWEGKTKALDDRLKRIALARTTKLIEGLNDYADFRDHLDERLDVLADMNSLRDDIHIDTDFEALLNRLLPLAAEKPPAPRPIRDRMPDDRFRSRIADEIREVLKRSKALNEALEGETRKAAPRGSKDVAQVLCELEPEKAIDDLLREATKAALGNLDAHRQEFDDTWEAAKRVLGWLSLLGVSPERIEELEQREDAGADFIFEIVVNTPLGVEIVSSRYRQIPPKLRAEKGKADVRGAQVIEPPAGDPSWNDDYTLEQLLLAIWACVFPEDSRNQLREGDVRILNSALKYREKHKTHHHYIAVSLELQDRLCRRDFYNKLMSKLPALTVIYFKSSGGESALRIADEYDFTAFVSQFLSIPDHLGKRT